jgi:iron(II)-dependent oxidoreductase
MVLNQIALKKHHAHKNKLPYTPRTPLKSQALIKNITHVQAATYLIGGELPLTFDNELPAHEIQLDDFFIANTPVTNGQYLLFIEEGSYKNQSLWSDDGWKWCTENNIQQPEHWQQNPQQHWYATHHLGPTDLNINDAVYGINHYEASAFANWAGARLPHEHEWETAARLEAIKHTTQVWEWCNNIHSPYNGFKAFPDSSNKPSNFDDKHYVLKGASPHTRPELKRASFRNAHLPHQRHIFAGLRLVFQ